MTKKLVCLLLILLCIFQSGCWDRRELNELAIVLAAGVDSTPEGNIELTVQIVRPRAFGGGAEKPGGQPKENNVWVVSQEGRSILDAQRLLEKKVSREMYWGHNVIAILGEDIARDGVSKVTNFFSRSPRVRETIWMFVAQGRAETVLNSHSQLEITSAQAAGFMIRAGTGIPVMLKDLKMMLASQTTHAVLPCIGLTPSGSPQGVGMKENIAEARGKQEDSTQVHAEVTICGTGAFKGDKLVGWLDISETRGLLWLTDQMEKGVITVPSTEDPDRQISIDLVRANTEVEPFWDGENLWFDVKIEMDGTLLEQQSMEDLTNPQIYRTIEENVSRAIERRARQCLEKAQYQFEADILRFGEAFHIKYKGEWAQIKDRWDEIFATADVNIFIDARIRQTGLETKRALGE
jgi:spore germination protein KC